MNDLICPKCSNDMESHHFGSEIEYHRCSGCHGIWFHADNVGEIESIPMLDVVDEGDPKMGAVYNRITDIVCPACAKPMRPIEVPRQKHIIIESCEQCSGIFLDAGELTDAKHYTLLEWLRDAADIGRWRS